MNRLPAVLQKEIWQYVRGDRAFWKTQYELVLDEFDTACDLRHCRVTIQAPDRDPAWSRCVADSRKWPGFGKFIRAFRRYLSSINVPMFPDSCEEWDIHADLWGKWEKLNVS